MPSPKNMQTFFKSVLSECIDVGARRVALASSLAFYIFFWENASAESEQSEPNMRIGQVDLRAHGGLRLGFSDNINYASKHGNRIADGFVEPYAGIGFHWPLTEMNSLTMDVGLSYRKYFTSSSTDQNNISITPDTAMQLELFVGKHWRFVIFDRMRYDHDPLDFPTISGTTRFGRFQNTAGVLGFWDIHPQVTLEVGYTNVFVMADSNEFNFLDRMTHIASAGIVYKINEDWRTGVRGSYAWTDYRTNFNNNSRVIRIGPFLEGRITDNLTFGIDTAFVTGEYDRSGLVGDTSNQSTYTATGWINHEVNQFLSHSIRGGRTSDLGDSSNFTSINFVRHQASWEVIRDVGLGTHAFLEFGDDSGGIASENFTRYGAGFNASYQLTKSITTSLRYTYLVKESDRWGRDYEQNMVVLDFNYRF